MSSSLFIVSGRNWPAVHLSPGAESNRARQAAAWLLRRSFALGIHPRRGLWGLQTHKTILLRAWKKMPALRRCPRFACAAGRRRVSITIYSRTYHYGIAICPVGAAAPLSFCAGCGGRTRTAHVSLQLPRPSPQRRRRRCARLVPRRASQRTRGLRKNTNTNEKTHCSLCQVR